MLDPIEVSRLELIVQHTNDRIEELTKKFQSDREHSNTTAKGELGIRYNDGVAAYKLDAYNRIAALLSKKGEN